MVALTPIFDFITLIADKKVEKIEAGGGMECNLS